MSKYDEFCERLAAKLIAAMETADGNWIKPWAGEGIPRNVATGKSYNGGNALWMMLVGAPGPWGTYKQWAAVGGQVRKGEKSTAILVPMFKKDDDGEQKMIGFRGAAVFSYDQQDGWVKPLTGAGDSPIDAAEAFFAAQGVSTLIGGDRACYSPTSDDIWMPPIGDFVSADAYYGTLAHEHVHATSHDKRVGRKVSTTFGSTEYAFEELVAEMGSAFCLAHLGLSAEPRPDHAQYLKNWIRGLHDDPKAAWNAAKLATVAFSYMAHKAGAKVDGPKLIDYDTAA